jgi:type II secretory pathway component PulK
MTPLPSSIPQSAIRNPQLRRRGTVLIVAMGVLAILTALVLTLARSMRVEAVTSANYTASVQSDAIELAGEQYAAELLVNQADQVLTMDYTNFTAIPVGNAGYFWIIRPNYDDPSLPSYGFIDENAKLNINTATEDMLLMLPGMTQDLADAIIDWRDDDEDPSASGAGAESQYYMTLPNPYQAKNAPFESVEELLLVRGFTRELLYGQSMADNNHFLPYDQTGSFTGNTVIGGGTSDLDPSLYRGLFDFLTVYSVANNPADPAAPGGNNGGNGSGSGSNGSQGGSRSQVAGGGSGSGNGGGSSGGKGGGTGSGSGGGSGSTATASGRINVNTAPREVLLCLPGLSESDVDAIISQRSSSLSSDPTDTTWLASTLGPKVNDVMNYVSTGSSYQYSADIVAVSANGRSFKRTRVIFDTRSGTPKIIYRRDLTPFGWPLDPQILDSLRHGAGIPGGSAASGNTGSSRRTM